MRWTLKPQPNEQKIQQLAQDIEVSTTIATLLVQRGITSYNQAKQFFRPSLKNLHDPFLMKDMDKAVARIEKAIKKNENILIYGDYDVDGTSAVALVSSFLQTLYPNIATYIPDRYTEGYGISYQGIDFAEDNNITLIIALDCGIKAIDKVAYATQKNIDFIICDHHLPGDKMPMATAILNPKRPDCSYPYKELCGCGVGFKLIHAITIHTQQSFTSIEPYLDLVATAIAADIVPITGENRVLTYHGLKRINSIPRAGIAAITKPLNKKLSITDVVFILAPRINAAGRMEHGQHAVNLLTETDFIKAQKMAVEIEQFNNERRNLDQQITQEALDLIVELNEQEQYTTVVYQENWHKGVIGIVASRLTETYYRPTVVFTKSGSKLTASARSVKEFDLYEALEHCQEYIEQFGGHKYAAGLTITQENYTAFKNKFEEVVAATINKKLLVPEITIDTQLQLKDITPKFYRIIKQFAPFGPENMAPVFLSEKLQDTGFGKAVGEEEKHLKISVIQQNSLSFTGIGFNLGNKVHLISNKKLFDAVYSLDENNWQGNVSIQLKIKDIKTC